MDSSTATITIKTLNDVVTKVIVHPVVLLSVIDHYSRMNKVGNTRRVVGVLLGSKKKDNIVEITNSYAVPFDEDSKDMKIWFLDHDYMDNMFAMFKKVNAREKIVGWYHTGPKLGLNDISIHKLMKKYFSQPVLVVIDAIPRDIGLPLDAYVMIEQINQDGTPNSLTFDHVHSEIAAEEAEEVGVEHLLRDIRNFASGNSIKQKTISLLDSLKGLQGYLVSITNYLKKVDDQTYPINQPILTLLQDFFNSIPDHSDEDFQKSLLTYTNDQSIILYIASMIRSILSINELIANKKLNKEIESSLTSCNSTQANTTQSTTVTNQSVK